MDALRMHTPLQKFFAGIATTFLLSMAMVAYVRSSGRKSVIVGAATSDYNEGLFDALEEKSDRSGKLELQDFHRVEVRDGKPAWEVIAKNARYFPDEEVTHVNQANVTIYREDGEPVSISSRAAKLHLSEGALRKAELEGGVRVLAQSNVRIDAEYAVYDLQRKQILVPEAVEITGDGFEVRGIGLEFEIDKQIVKLQKQVYSFFAVEARVPSGVAKARK